MIRLFRLPDMFILRKRAPEGVAFDLRRLLLDAPSPMRAALVGYLTRHHMGAITCVHEGTPEGRRPGGLIQALPREDRTEWDLAFLVPSLDRHQGAGAVWRELLTHLTVLGAQHGVLRIYVRSSEDAEAEDIFRQAGYKVVAREEVYVLTKRPAPAPLPRGLRRASSRDVPGLEDLSCHALPQAVQQVRGLMAPWQGGWRRAPWSSVLATDYVWAEKDKILAHLALRSTARGHWLEVAMRPERRADTLPHIKHMLTLAQSSASTPIYCPVPDYGVGLGWLLRTLGFESYARQVLLVVHTAPRIRVRQKIRLMGLERSVDAGTPIGRASRTGWPAD